MITTLQFNCPEEQIELQTAIDAGKWKSVATELDEQLRQWVKYGHQFKHPTEALENTRMRLFDLLQENNLELHE